ncbi:hypothetical protein PoB_001460100 [Plakobranchus ocellatus]|uniref:Uncharacterized protein n=1 Tax=Plakobranchus ocellatus TaxID=259542 RepID=A0AAV3YX66_9GAST|nr:hypothetical protein PoB_001460100 [Plakobranchus ocellatus]
MAEAGHVKLGVVGPRPLGLVKRETVHFEDSENQMEEVLTSRAPGKLNLGGNRLHTDGLQSRGKSRGGGSRQRSELRSMRNLQETLRQAALLNIVAAVNHDGPPPPPSEQTARIGGNQSVGIKGANLLGHTVPGAGAKKLVLLHGQGYGDYTSGSFSRHLQGGVAAAPVHGVPPVPPNTASNPNSTLSNLLSQRSRTISIPRPRTQSEQSSFMHNSLVDAKEQLVNMTQFRTRSNLNTEGAHGMSINDATAEDVNQQCTAATPKIAQNQIRKPQDSYKVTLNSGDSPYALQGVSVETSGNTVEVSSHAQPNQTSGDQKKGPQASMKSKEDKRAHNVQQMQSLKRHISTSKKKELMMKLTEMAKCEAVDINEPMRRGADKSAPSIIILAQKKGAPFRSSSPEMLASVTNDGAHPPVRDVLSSAPLNTRIHCETADAIAAYRQSKGLDTFEVGDDLRIESISSSHVPDQNIEFGPKRDGRKNVLNGFQSNVIDLNMWVREHLFSDSIIGKTMQSPDLMELRPVDANSPSPVERGFIADKKRFMASKRLPVYSVRDKLYSPSPVVYEATYHRPKASTGDISLVGQSLPSLSSVKSPLQTSKPSSKRVSSDNTRAPSQEDQHAEHDETHLKHLAELPDRKQNLTFCKPWGSTSKQPSTASPILRTEILDHLQCVGIIDRRPPNMSQKKSISKISGINKIGLGAEDSVEGEFYDEEFDRCSETGVRTTRPEFRKSKLYSAFRASEENLATMADNSSLVSENLTTKSLLNQPVAALLDKPAPGDMQSKEADKPVAKEPLYMGCSSMVSENEIRSQFHYVNGEDNALAQKNANFKVLKALDQDVYFDFQHRKYRSGNNNSISTSLNTGANKPRMHFLKIKFPGES